MRQTVRPTVAPTPTLTRQSQPSTDLLTRVNEACRPDLHRNRAPTLVHRTVMPDYRADRGFLRLFIGDAQGIGVRTNSVVPDYLGDTAFSRHCRFQRGQSRGAGALSTQERRAKRPIAEVTMISDRYINRAHDGHTPLTRGRGRRCGARSDRLR